MTLCAILLAGVALDGLLRARRTQPLGAMLVVAQILVTSAAIWPFVAMTLEPEARQAWWFRGATGETRMVDALLGLMSEPGRLTYSPQLDAEISERGRLGDGLGINALVYRGVSVVNGSFKGISTDVLWPDDRLFYGRIRTPAGLIQSDASLDVLGIRYVLANPGEPVAPGLTPRGTVAKQDGTVIVLYENADAWTGAFTIPADASDVGTLPRHAGCDHDRLLCKDLAPLARRRLSDDLQLARDGGDIVVTGLDGAANPRLLIVAEMFRPAWHASTNGMTLPTTSVGPGLLGVTLPPGATAVRLEYRPTLLIEIHLWAWSALAAGLVALGAAWRRPSRLGSAS